MTPSAPRRPGTVDGASDGLHEAIAGQEPAASAPGPGLDGERALLDFAVSNSPVVFYVVEPTGSRPLTFISSNVETLTGHRVEGFTRDPWLGRKLIHPDDLAAYDAAVARALADGEAVHEYRMRDADGTQRWYRDHMRITPRGGARNRSSLVGCMVDVSAERRAEDRRRESEERFRAILETYPLPVWLVDLESGEILYESPATRKLFGADEPGPGEPARTNYANPADRADYLSRLREHGALDGYELELVRSDGSRFWGAVSARLIDFEGEEVVVSSIIDLTPRRSVETELARQREALHRSEKLSSLGVLLAGVAHELNNPLSVVVGQAQLLQETATDARIAHRAQRIAGAADRCTRIVRAFLAMARQTPAECAAVAVNEVVEDTLDVTAGGLRSHGVDVRMRLTEALPPVWADASQLSQVLANLVLNAQQALQDHDGERVLEVCTRNDLRAGAVVVEVRDSGPGMTADVRARVFDPFFTTRDVGTGTGIGLAVSHRIVEAHGGTLDAESAPGAGATFTIRLPADAAPEAGAGGRQPGAEGTGALSILLIDDEPSFTTTLADVLADEGHRVDVASTGMAALDLLEQRRFDAILSDLRMPSLDGPGLFRVLEEQRPELLGRLGFITGDALSPSMRLFLKGTGCPHLEKVAGPERIVAMLETLAGGRGAGENPRAEPG